MNNKAVFITIALLAISPIIFAQAQLQNIRGTVLDKYSQAPLPQVEISIAANGAVQTTITDSNGNYLLRNIAPGRYDVNFFASNYKPATLSSIIVNAGKETILDIQLEEKINTLQGVKVKGNQKNKLLNELATTSARTFSTEEVNRYAGGRSDPGRLVSNFAGVSTPNDSRNDIVIRGNSPTGVLWRIEGMNVPNPNHFATVGTTGGPVSALNTNMLKNSDFFTSAFPAEYGNANAGVFDLGFRKGNTQKREHTIQIGALTGVEAMTEGPIKKGNGSSYLIAYRYSFTGVAQAVGLNIGTTATPFYQDVSFKINSGDGKYGRFTLFGLGGTSTISFKHDKIDSADLFADPTQDSYFESKIGVLGLKHFFKINSNSYVNTVIGATYSGSHYLQDSVGDAQNTKRVVNNKSDRSIYNLHTTYNNKVSNRIFVRAGAQADAMNLSLHYGTRLARPTWQELWNYSDLTTLFQSYLQVKYSINNQLTANLGLHTQWLTLNNSKSLEPRIGIKYTASQKSTLSFGYGMHSQMQAMDVYFYREPIPNGSYDKSNEQLDFTRAHHFVVGYDFVPAKDWRIKIESYYQHLYNVPVSKLSNSFSMLNNGASFTPTNAGNLTNSGTGTNYGLELTVEKFYSKGYYGLLTATLYNALYKGSDGVERNTAFNGKYVFNILGGKEIKLGSKKQNTISTDAKLTTAGGRYYTPVDLAASQAINWQVEKGDAFAFTQRNPAFFRLDIKAGYTYNSTKRKVSHSIFFDVQNVTNNKNVFAERYNTVTKNVNTAYQIGLFPNFAYKLQF